jgi:hypothetical protein
MDVTPEVKNDPAKYRGGWYYLASVDPSICDCRIRAASVVVMNVVSPGKYHLQLTDGSKIAVFATAEFLAV